MRPDRSVVIRYRIVAGLAVGHRPNAPAREELRSQQTSRDFQCAFGMRDAGEQQLAGIRTADATRLLGAVERQSVGFQLRTPESGLKMFGQSARPFLEAASFVDEPNSLGASRRRLPCSKHISLNFSKRDVPFGQSAVSMKDCVVGILPALVCEARLSRAPIFHEAVLIRVAGAIHPAQCSLDGGPELG